MSLSLVMRKTGNLYRRCLSHGPSGRDSEAQRSARLQAWRHMNIPVPSSGDSVDTSSSRPSVQNGDEEVPDAKATKKKRKSDESQPHPFAAFAGMHEESTLSPHSAADPVGLERRRSLALKRDLVIRFVRAKRLSWNS